MSKVIHITGNSGKTTLSYFLGMMLATDGKKTIIISTDHNMPVFQLILERKHSAEHKSLGRILSSPIIDARTVLDNAIPFQCNKNLAVISYDSTESENTFPRVVEKDVAQLVLQLKSLVDYVIIDTQTAQNYNDLYLSKLADKSVCIVSADIKGIAYMLSRRGNSAIKVLLNTSLQNLLEDVKKTFDTPVKYVLILSISLDTFHSKIVFLDFGIGGKCSHRSSSAACH